MNEEFCFWSFSRWKQEVSEAGFKVLETPNDPLAGSRGYTSEWIVKNRLEGKVALHRMVNGRLERMGWPVTNMVLVAEK
jgi:hypothetical protein